MTTYRWLYSYLSSLLLLITIASFDTIISLDALIWPRSLKPKSYIAWAHYAPIPKILPNNPHATLANQRCVYTLLSFRKGACTFKSH
jgi:hypothetical protein